MFLRRPAFGAVGKGATLKAVAWLVAGVTAVACTVTDGEVDFSPGAAGGSGGAVGGSGGSSAGGSGGVAGGSGGTSSAGDGGLGGSSGEATGGASGAGGVGGIGGTTAVGGESGSPGQGGGGTGATGGEGGEAGNGNGGSGGCASSEEVCDGLDNDCDDEVDPPGTCPQGCTGHTFEEHRYVVCGPVNVSQQIADTRCGMQQLSLVTLDSAAENEFVHAHTTGKVWIGASDRLDEGTWRWPNSSPFWTGGADGEPVDGAYANWAPAQPNNGGNGGGLGSENCAIMQGDGKWNDVSCLTDINDMLSYVCETPVSPEAD